MASDNNKRMEAEYARLSALFNDVEDNRKELVDELLKKASYIKVKLDDLEDSVNRLGAIQTSNKGNQRESVCYKTYLSTVSIYQSIIRTLNGILSGSSDEGDDTFDEFIRKASDELPT